jgi:hypothetical protein
MRRPGLRGQREQEFGCGASEVDRRLSKNAAKAKTNHGVSLKIIPVQTNVTIRTSCKISLKQSLSNVTHQGFLGLAEIMQSLGVSRQSSYSRVITVLELSLAAIRFLR